MKFNSTLFQNTIFFKNAMEHRSRMSNTIHNVKDLHEPIWFDDGSGVDDLLKAKWTFKCKECQTLYPCRTMLVINGVELS